MTPGLHALSLVDAVHKLADGAMSALDYADALLDRVDATDQAIGAWAYLDATRVRREAAEYDRAARAAPGPLHGIAVGMKDIVSTRDQPTRMGSRAFADYQPDDDAVCVKRLRTAGGYAFGKTVTAELAFLEPGKTRNPWNARHTPGGSSQGSAAAVAAGHVPAALGTQTNGSVIRPAAFCGVVGFKPTLDTLPFEGVHLFSRTLDTLGTFTRSVADCRHLVAALTDSEAADRWRLRQPDAPRLAYLAAFPWTQPESDALDALDAAATKLGAEGAGIVPVAMPDALLDAKRIHRTIMLHEAASELGLLQAGARALLSRTLNDALDEGRSIAKADYRHALASRAAMIATATDWMDRYDAVLAPPALGGAPEGLAATGDPACCTLASLLGAPAITLPIAFDGRGLPLGLQLIASPGNDARLLAVADWCETRLPFRGLL